MKKNALGIIFAAALVLLSSCSDLGQENNAQVLQQNVSSSVTTNSSVNERQSPNEVFILNSREEIDQLRQLAAGEEKLLNEYLSSKSTGGLHSKAEVQMFLKLIDSMIIPEIPKSKKFTMYYCPEKPYLHVVYNISETEWYRFEYIISEDTERELPQFFETNCEVMDARVYSDKNSQVTLVANQVLIMENSTYYSNTWLKMDRYYACVHYKNDSVDPNKVNLEQLFKECFYKQPTTVS